MGCLQPTFPNFNKTNGNCNHYMKWKFRQGINEDTLFNFCSNGLVAH